MKTIAPLSRKEETEFEWKLHTVYPNEKLSYRSLVETLGQTVVNEVVIPTVNLSYELGLVERASLAHYVAETRLRRANVLESV